MCYTSNTTILRLVFDLLQRAAVGRKFHHFEFKVVNTIFKLHRHVDAAWVGAVFERNL